MKVFSPLLVLALCSFAFTLPQAVHAPPPGEGPIRTPATPAIKKLKPGDPCHTNNDGVTVCNTGSAGDGDITVNPQSGNANSDTTVDMRNDSHGTVTGLDAGDTVDMSAGSSATISGTGGTVNAVAGSSGTVTNTGAAGGGSITITGGSVPVHVPPGSTVNFG